MRKTIGLLVFFTMVQSLSLHAQQTPALRNFESLQINSSPAYILLGIEPDNIQRPATPSQFIAGLQNAVVNNKLQPNLAMEISPYYLRHSKDTGKLFNPTDYLLNKKNLGGTIFQTLSVSFATSQTDSVTFGRLKSGTGIGIGMHFLLIDGTPGYRFKKWGDTYLKSLFFDKLLITVRLVKSDQISDIDRIIDRVFDIYLKSQLPAQKFNTLSKKELKGFITDFKKQVEYDLQAKGIGTDKNKLIDYLTNIQTTEDRQLGEASKELSEGVNPLAKQGFMLEVDAGQAYLFQDNNFSQTALAKSAVWLSPSYRWDVASDVNQISLLDLMGVLRYTFNNISAKVDVSNYFDAGLKGAFTHDKWMGSIECVYRYADILPSGYIKHYTYRLTAGMSYKLSNMITFKFNFGTNFDGNTTTYSNPKKMFAIGGLNFGFLNFKNVKGS